MPGPLERLRELGLELPTPPAALASYVPFTITPISDSRLLVFVAGQIALKEGKPAFTGSVPSRVSMDEAKEAARLCALNILAQAQAAGGLDKVERIVQLTAFVLSDDGFSEQPAVANAASELLVEVLGERGRHARIAVGTNALPLQVPVEIGAVLVLRDD